MQLGSSKIISGARYIYLAVFFALLAGVFYPVITHSAWEPFIAGMLILFTGLAGTVALYKAGTSDKNRKPYLITGLAITGIALFFVFAVTARI